MRPWKIPNPLCHLLCYYIQLTCQKNERFKKKTNKKNNLTDFYKTCLVFIVQQGQMLWMPDQFYSLCMYTHTFTPLQMWQPYIAWKNLTSAVHSFLWSPLDDFYSVHKPVCTTIVSQPSYSYALMTDKPSHSWDVLKSVHSSCHNKHCTWVAWTLLTGSNYKYSQANQGQASGPWQLLVTRENEKEDE